MAMDFVASVLKTLNDCCTSKFFHEKIWVNVQTHLPTMQRRRGTMPSHFQECLLLEGVGHGQRSRAQENFTEEIKVAMLYFFL